MKEEIFSLINELCLNVIDKHENVYVIISKDRDKVEYGDFLSDCDVKHPGVLSINRTIVNYLSIDGIGPTRVTDKVYIFNEQEAIETLNSALNGSSKGDPSSYKSRADKLLGL